MTSPVANMNEDAGALESSGAAPQSAVEFDAPFRVSTRGVAILADESKAAAMRETFARMNGLALLNVIDPPLLEALLRLRRRAVFQAATTPSTPTSYREVDTTPRLAEAFCMALSRPELLSWMQAMTGCRPLDTMEGVVASMGQGHTLDWHRDSGLEARRLAIVINLTEAAYEGGRFELRVKGALEPTMFYDHLTPGSAMIFRVDDTLQHRVTPVTGGGPRVAFTGWFRSAFSDGEKIFLPNAARMIGGPLSA